MRMYVAWVLIGLMLAGSAGIAEDGGGGDDVKEKLAAFRKAYASRDESERVSAVRDLTGLYDDAVTQALVALLTKDTEGVRIAAAEALGRQGDDHAVTGLSKAVKPNRKNPGVIRAIAASLGKCDSDRALPALYDLFDEKEEGIAEAAMMAVQQIASPDSMDTLLDLLHRIDMEKSKSEGASMGNDQFPSNEMLLSLEEPTLAALGAITKQSFESYREWKDWWKKNSRRCQYATVYWCPGTRQTFEIGPGERPDCPYDGAEVKRCGVKLHRRMIPPENE